MSTHLRLLGSMLAVFLITPTALFAQTIQIDSVSTPTACDTAQVTVYYTATGTFSDKNVFSVELSATDSSFSPSFTNIGSVKSTGSGSITVPIPAFELYYDHYRVRVASSNPYVVSDDNGNNIQVLLSPFPGFYAFKDSLWSITNPGFSPMNALEGEPLVFLSLATHWSYGTVSCEWNFGDGATPATSMDSLVSVTYSTPGQKQISLKVTNADGCSRDTTLANIMIFDCNPAIPSNVLIDSATLDVSADTGGPPGNTSVLRTDVWVVPGGTLSLPDYSACTVFAEPGSTINGGYSMYDTIYLRSGASYTDNGNSNVIIYEPGASITYPRNRTLECNSLSFDYSNAPPYKIMLAGVAPSAQQVEDIPIYPNPAQGIVTVESKQIPSSIFIRNELGEEILEDRGPLLTNQFEFDVSQFSGGVYYVMLNYGNDMHVQKFTIGR